jgi:hypothetical protein
MSRRRTPPFKQRVEAALAAAKAAGAERIKIVTPDGAAYEIDFVATPGTKANDFDRPPNPISLKSGSRST